MVEYRAKAVNRLSLSKAAVSEVKAVIESTPGTKLPDDAEKEKEETARHAMKDISEGFATAAKAREGTPPRHPLPPTASREGTPPRTPPQLPQAQPAADAPMERPCLLSSLDSPASIEEMPPRTPPRRPQSPPPIPRPPPPSQAELAKAIAASEGGEVRTHDLRKLTQMERTMVEAQISQLSAECFKEDSVVEYERREGWCMVACHQGAQLLGYLVYRRWPAPLRMVVVLRLAVPSWARGCGYGSRLMHWVMGHARQLQVSECGKVGLSSLPGAVGFYSRLGFAPGPASCPRPPAEDETLGDGGKLEEGQVWMERKVERSGGAKARTGSRSRSRK